MTPHPTRDIRLTLPEINELRDAARRRRGELQRRLDRMGPTKPGMIAANEQSIETLSTVLATLTVAASQMRRKEAS